jgi:hypothetical protein
MKKKILIILILFCYNKNFAQINNGIDNKFSIKVNPLALIDVYGSYSYRIGAEFKIYKNFATSIELGNYFNYGKNDGLRDNSKGFIIKPEIKMYLNENKLTTGEFVSLEYQYKEIAFNYNDSIKTAPIPTYEKEYRIYKNISCINLKYGNLKVYKNNFLFEYYFGAGIRVCKGYNSLSEIENNGVLTGEGHGSEIGDAQRSINYVKLNLTLGFKLGYSFK